MHDVRRISDIKTQWYNASLPRKIYIIIHSFSSALAELNPSSANVVLVFRGAGGFEKASGPDGGGGP